MYRILLAIDGSDHSDKVVKEALKIAEGMEARVTIMNVVGKDDSIPRIGIHISDDYWNVIRGNLKSKAEEVVEKAAKLFRDKGLKVETRAIMSRYTPAETIVYNAKRDKFDLVIVGSRGIGGIREAFLGSVSNKIVHRSGTNVLIVK